MSESPFANPGNQEKSDRLRAELRQYEGVRFLDLPTGLQSKVRQLLDHANEVRTTDLYPKGLDIGAVQLVNAVSENDFADLIEVTISSTYFLIDWVDAELIEIMVNSQHGN